MREVWITYMYEERYVAFIDILGFKNIVNNTYTIPAEFNRLEQALKHIESLKNDNYRDPYGKNWLGMEFTMFSDSIVISYPASGYGNAFHILMEIAFICLDMLDMGYIFRGGITVGALIHKGDICYGPAMNSAVELEKRAKYPRIIIERAVLEKGVQYPGTANTPEQEVEYLRYLVLLDSGNFLKGSEQELILNYLALYNEVNDEETYISLICKTRQLIIGQYRQASFITNVEERRNIQQKYIWFAGYFNYTVESVFKDYQQYIILLN